jgi:hypothetical protein
MVVAIGDVTYRVSNMDPFELYCLAAIGRIHKPEPSSSSGRTTGTTTLWLAKHLPESEMFTLDLPLDSRDEWHGTTLAASDGDGLGAASRERSTSSGSRSSSVTAAATT